MGDDVLPHDETIDLPPETSLADTVAYLLKRRYLAAADQLFVRCGGSGVSLRFRDWMQHDPDRVVAELAAGRMPRR